MEQVKHIDTQSPELLRKNQFAQKFPFISVASLNWQIHNSKQNGLDECRAILRVRNNPTSKRAVLFLNVPRYFAWMERGGAKAP